MKKIYFLIALTILVSAMLVSCISSCSPKKTEQWSSVSDLEGKRIGIMVGSIYEDYVVKHIPNAKRVYFESIPDLLVALKTDKVDAFATNGDAYLAFTKEHPDVGQLIKDVEMEDLGFAFSQANPQLRQLFNAFLKELHDSGELEKICDKWMYHFDVEEPPILTSNGNGGPIRFATSGVNIPCSFTKNGQLAGHDVELMYRYASKHNLKLDVQRIPFGGLVAAVTSGKVDVAADGITITPERKKQIAFSDAYKQKGLCIVVLKKNIATSEIDEDKIRRIAVLVGSTHEKTAKKKFPNTPLMLCDATPDMIIALKSKKVDAFIADDIATNLLLEQDNNLRVLQRGIEYYDIAAGINKDNTDLLNSFNKLIKEKRASGDLAELENKWINNYEKCDPPINTGDGSGGILRFGTTGVDMPYSYVKNGKPSGLDVAVVYLYASQHNLKVEIQNFSFGGLIAALNTGKVDIISSGISVTTERSKQVAFAEPHTRTGVDIIGLKNDKKNHKFKSVDDVSTKRIGVLIGSIHDIFATKHFTKASLFRGEDLPDLVAALQAKKIDAILMNEIACRFYLEKYPDMGILEKNIWADSLGVAFNYKNATLRQSFNEFLKELQESGEMAKIYDKWENHLDETPVPVVTGDGSGGLLRLGTTGVSIPFSFVKDGKPAGVEVEMMYRFASKHNMKVEVQKMLFSGLIPSLITGKIDVLASSIGMTDERKKQVAFSESHIQIPIHVVALKDNIAACANDEKTTVKKGFLKSVAESFNNNLVVEKRYMLIVNGLTTTITITLFAVLFGTIFGGLICFLCMNRNKFWRGVGKTYVSIVAGTPVLVFLMIMFYIVFAKLPISPVLVAILALALAFGAYVSQIYQTSIQTIGKGQTEAGIAMGFTKVGTFIHIVMPQAIRVALPLYRGEVISMLKTTAIVGYIAVEDLTKAGDIIRSRTFDAFFPLIVVAIIYFVLARLLAYILERITQNTDPKYKLAKMLRKG